MAKTSDQNCCLFKTRIYIKDQFIHGEGSFFLRINLYSVVKQMVKMFPYHAVELNTCSKSIM